MIFRPYFVLFVSTCLEAFFLQCGFGVLFRFLFYFIGFTLEYALRVDM